jgi:prepilin-type N-terminal cleavage/methylation domain-containing protein/prepilin-type processing-associated H-X9-DG protein
MSAGSKRCGSGSRGFTLIELLVVVAIIAVLISILLPALSSARNNAKAVKCGANLHSVGQAFGVYLAEYRGAYPASYYYANNNGWVDPFGAPFTSGAANFRSYVHWSWFLFSDGAVDEGAFQCPSIPNGGMPRTNPGGEPRAWEAGQSDSGGVQNAENATREDRQAVRMAYVPNAAVVPRNKFTAQHAMASGGSGGVVNKWVHDREIAEGEGVILATEYAADYRLASVDGSGGGWLCKSHRSVSPFYNASSGFNPYGAGPFSQWWVGSYSDTTGYRGLKTMQQFESMAGIVFSSGGSVLDLNACGRHHPGGDRSGNMGGTTNFLYCDGSVQRKTLYQSMKDFEWGSKYYSLRFLNSARDAEITRDADNWN